jgi:hypothetical protein
VAPPAQKFVDEGPLLNLFVRLAIAQRFLDDRYPVTWKSRHRRKEYKNHIPPVVDGVIVDL